MRRQIAIILGITALVVVVVLVLGPKLVSVSSDMPKSKQPSTKPLPADPCSGPDTAAPPAISSEQDAPATLRLRPTDAVTGTYLAGAKAEITNLFTDSILWGEWPNSVTNDIQMKVTPGVYRVHLSLRSYLRWSSGPIELAAGATLDLGDVALTPTYEVSLWPADDADLWKKARITRLWPPPAIVGDLSLEIEASLQEGGRVQLTPGRYSCCLLPDQVSPYAKPEVSAAEDYGPQLTYEFEVVDKPLFLRPEFHAKPGQCSVEVQVFNLDGEVPRPNWVWAVAHCPPMRDAIVGAGVTNERGKVTLNGLRAGEFTLVAGRKEFAAETPGAISRVTLNDSGRPASAQLRIREFAFDGKTTWQSEARMEVQVTQHGLPVEGVQLLDIDADRWFDDPGAILAATDVAGRITLDTAAAGVRHFRFGGQTLRVFERRLLPGETTQWEVELCPIGTSILTGKLDMLRHRVVHVRAETGVKHDPTVEFEVNQASEFVVLDVPFGYQMFEAMIDGGHTIDFGVEIPAEPETQWTSALELQAVRAELPEDAAGNAELLVALQGPFTGEFNSYVHYNSNVEAVDGVVTLFELRPGRYRAQLQRDREVWISEEFVVLNSPVHIGSWSREPDASAEPVRPARSDVDIAIPLPLRRMPPWTMRLSATVVAGAEEELSSDTRAGAYLSGSVASIWALVPPESEWVEVTLESMKPIRVPVDLSQTGPGGTLKVEIPQPPESLSMSRLILFESSELSGAVANELWNMKVRINGEADGEWLSLVADRGRFSDRFVARPVAGAQLVTWRGVAGLWLPELPMDCTSIELDVAGFKPMSVDVQRETAGYLEQSCTLNRAK